MTISDFNVEQSEDCWKDRLEIYNGHSYESPFVGRFCGKLQENIGNPPPKQIESLTNSIRLFFISDEEVEDTGFAFRLMSKMINIKNFNMQSSSSFEIFSVGIQLWRAVEAKLMLYQENYTRQIIQILTMMSLTVFTLSKQISVVK